MDTKLKRSRTAGTYAGSVILLISVVIAVSGVSVGLFLNYYEYYLEEEHVKESSRALLESFLSADFTIVTLAGIIAAAALILVTVCAGKRNEDGTMHYTWFDKIHNEFKIIAGTGIAFPLAMLTVMLSDVLQNSTFGTLMMKKLTINSSIWYDHYSSFGYGGFSLLPEWFVIMIFLMAITAMVLIYIAIYISFVKRFKDHSFWKGFLIVEAVKKGIEAVKRSERTELVVISVLIAGIVISATALGSIPVLILTLVFVPRLMKQYREIRNGVNRVKEGEVSYKIPVTSKTDLGRLAEEINEVSSATELAIAEELKHQKMKTDLISNVSHDLKTPLTSMISYVDLLKREGLDSENAEEYLRIIDEKTKRLKQLTENLFEAAKASSGEIPVNKENLQVGALLNQAVAELEERFEERSLEIIYENKTETDEVISDGQLLWRVIENLLVNVSKYALENSRVYIDLYNSDDEVVLEIKNMSKERLNISVDELMERFTRGDESRNTEGSGLGLAIAKDLTELIGGEFRLAIDGDLFKAAVSLPYGE